jgi:acyl-phosphate glycerol 3-phosphate acyltransferase
MNTTLLGTIACAAAYLIGSIPFGYLIARAAAGIDIRTVGSGNIGATNVGRTLGFRFFLFVFLLDAAKGFLPTFFLPRLVASLMGSAVPDLAPIVAMATVLGHNFPIYLRFKGGKGVATTLGAVFALDPTASLGAVVGFVIFVLLTRFVSLASLGGALVFAGVYFTEYREPFARDHAVMSGLVLVMLVLLFYRHRKNLGRIAAGTEPKVNLRKKRSPDGKVRVGLILLVVVAAAGTALALNAARRPEVLAGGKRITEVARFATGHQRAERLAFLDGGKLLAITCPRYMRLVLARVTATPALELAADIKLEGRPVAIAAASDRVYVLQRPHGDARHLEEAWWDTFDLAGRPVESRVRVGWDPDDMAISPDGKYAYILTSGLAEGETNRPNPALITFDLTATPPRAVGRLSFDAPRDNPERLILLPDRRAAVSLSGSNAIARIDLSDPAVPKPIDRIATPEMLIPDALAVARDGHLLVGNAEAHAYWREAGGSLIQVDVEGGVADLVEAEGLIFATLPKASGLAVLSAEAHASLGSLPLRGAANLATTRPLGIAYSPDRKLIAVSNRAGGSVHLIAIE